MGEPKLVTKSFFDEKVGKCFIEATIKTLESFVGAKPTFSDKHQLASNLNLEYDIAGKIQFEADGMQVQLVTAFKKEVIFFIYEKMLGSPINDLNADVQDCVGELTNIIYGYAKAPLVNDGHSFSMAKPIPELNVNSLFKDKKSLEIPFEVNNIKRGFSIILSV